MRRYVKRLCTRLLPRTENTAREELRLLSAVTPKGEVFYQHTADDSSLSQILLSNCCQMRSDIMVLDI